MFYIVTNCVLTTKQNGVANTKRNILLKLLDASSSQSSSSLFLGECYPNMLTSIWFPSLSFLSLLCIKSYSKFLCHLDDLCHVFV